MICIYIYKYTYMIYEQSSCPGYLSHYSLNPGAHARTRKRTKSVAGQGRIYAKGLNRSNQRHSIHMHGACTQSFTSLSIKSQSVLLRIASPEYTQPLQNGRRNWSNPVRIVSRKFGEYEGVDLTHKAQSNCVFNDG